MTIIKSYTDLSQSKTLSMEMIKKVITYKDPYGNIYKTNPIPASLVESKICSIQRTNDNNATIISVQ